MPTTGTGFTNLQQVLQANQPGQLANAVSSGITGAANQTNQDLGQQQSQFQTQSQAGNLASDANKQYEQSVLGQVAQSGQFNDPNAANQFAQFRGGQYTGPQGLGNTSQLQGEAQQAQTLGEATRSAGGRQGLLQRFAATGPQQYNQGQQQLDTMLLGSAGGTGLQQARRETAGLTGQVNQAVTGAQQQAQGLQSQAQQFGQQTAQDVAKQQAGLQGALQTQQQKMANQQTQNFQNLQQGISSGTITQDQANQLGLSQGENTYGLNLGNYVQQGAGPTLANAANQQQLAQAGALAQLGGGKALVTQPQSPFQSLNVNSNLQSDITARQGALQQTIQRAQSDVLNNPNNAQADYLMHQLSPSGGDYNRLKQSGVTMQQLISTLQSGNGAGMVGYTTVDPQTGKIGVRYGDQNGISASSPQELAQKLQQATTVNQQQITQQQGFSGINYAPNQGQ